MICGDQHGTAHLQERLFQPLEAGIDGFSRLHSRRHDTRVADHVTVGIIYDNQIKFRILDGIHKGVGNSLAQTFR